jgi:DNA modification methylase
MKLIPDKSIEFICCDLPYGSTANKWDDALPNELLWEQYIRIIKEQDQVHPTQKPVPLLQWLVRSFTNEGDIVLDNTAGSGSLGLACIEENRDFILIEKEPNYYEVIKERIGKIFKNYGLDLQPLLDEQV